MRTIQNRRHYINLLAGIILIAGIVFFSTSPSVAAAMTASARLTAEPVAASLSAGLLHSAMINYDGQLYVWGDNTYGQLGLTGDDYYDSPQWLELSDTAAAVSLGAYHTLVLLADGTVWSFGRNAFGQLGTGGTENSGRPVQVGGLPPIVDIAAGSWHSLALGEDGSVWAWGNNTNYQIGDVESEIIKGTGGQVLGSRCPLPVKIISAGAAAIAAGGLHSLYLDVSGQVFAWGDNSKGQLGDGTNQPHAIPAIVPGLSGVSGIAAGYQHSLAVIRGRVSDQLFAWGDDSLGQLGIGAGLTADSFRTVPVRVDLTRDTNPDNDRVLKLKAAFAQSAVTMPAIDANGISDPERQQLLVWGSNSNGQLALGDTSSQNLPDELGGTYNFWTGSDFLPFDDIALGGSHMLVLSSKGLLAAAGRGDRGQLGNVSVLDRSRLVPVDVPDVIRPVWVGSCQISAVYNESEELVVRWPAAQDNRTVANYRVKLASPMGTIKIVDAGNQLSWAFDGVNPEVAYKISVMACDADSVSASEESLSRLVGYRLPATALPGASAADYFSEIFESVPQVNFAASNWQPDSKNLVRPLEVPWDISSIYGKDAVERPADWRVFNITIGGAALLAVLMLLDIWRRKVHKKETGMRSPVSTSLLSMIRR